MTTEIDGQLPRPPGLLRLPQHLRHRIYLHAGVARFGGRKNVHYLESCDETDFRPFPSKFDPPPPCSFIGLLRTCRTLYAEVASLFYSANRFVIFYRGEGTLDRLRRLSPTALAALTSLKVVLTESSCHHAVESRNYPPECCCNSGDGTEYWSPRHRCDEFHSRTHRSPLLDGSDREAPSETPLEGMLGEWHHVAMYLSRHVPAGRLELSLVCDIDHRHQHALHVAHRIVAPLGAFPPLRDCHVRLGKDPHRPLQRIAEDAVLHARRLALPGAAPHTPAAPPAAAHLLALPRELRLYILEHTDLVTPWKEVTWSRHTRRFQVCRPPCLLPDGPGCPPDMHAGCRLSRCDVALSDPDPDSPGCFCRRRHAAFSRACACWAPPGDLFLVCRALHRDAQLVFFSANRFVVHDFTASPPWALPAAANPDTPDDFTNNDDVLPAAYPYPRLAASDFLRHAVPEPCLGDLRFLELVFPPYAPGGWPAPGHAALRDWSETLRWARPRIAPAALTVRLVAADFFCGPIVGRAALSLKQGGAIMRAYAAIAGPLAVWVRGEEGDGDGEGGAGCRFFAQIAHPWRWTEGVRRKMQQSGSAWLVDAARSLRDGCEGFVRGHGAEARHAERPPESVWQRQYDVDPFA